MMRDIPSIVEELRNNEAYNANQIQDDQIINNDTEMKKQNKLNADDSLDDLWFDMWKVL
jgi:hypothetical protein